jgi:hypothetical protein
MGIKVTQKPALPKDSKPYPKLMFSQYGQVVLMHTHECGTLVNGERSEIGCHSESWDMGIFRDFDGSITLQNE